MAEEEIRVMVGDFFLVSIDQNFRFSENQNLREIRACLVSLVFGDKNPPKQTKMHRDDTGSELLVCMCPKYQSN